MLAEVGAVVDGLRGISPLMRVLSAYLQQSLRDADIKQAARACAMSPRTLQRQLAALGTTFGEELTRARVRAASELLQASEDKIAAIAIEVGCSASRLSAMFRRATGETPAQYRERMRAAS